MARAKSRSTTKKTVKKAAKKAPKKKTAAKKKVKATGLEPTHRLRIRLMLFALLLGFGIISSRLVKLQLEPDERSTVIDIGIKKVLRPRGDIRDIHGKVLATNEHSRILTADPSRIDDPETIMEYLRARIDFDEEAVTRRLGNKNSQYAVIKRHLNAGDVAALQGHEEDAAGKLLTLSTDLQRFYPNGALASPVIGFLTDGRGQEGIERTLNETLQGTPGYEEARVHSDRKILRSLTLESEPATGGDDVYLTINASLQFQLEGALDKAMEMREAPEAMGILMDPHTGAILAMACRPSFDPNRYADYSDWERRNKAVIDKFEPGSAIKIVMAAAALEVGIVTPETMFDCQGGEVNHPYRRGTLKDSHKRDRISFTQCIAESSNIAMIEVAENLGSDQVDRWMRRFGFGQRTNVGLPAETAGNVWPLYKPVPADMWAVPIGQGIGVNLVQLARAFSVIANGGFLVQPYLVEKTVSPEGEVTNVAPSGRERVISEETSRTMRRLLYAVVTGEEATGRGLAETIRDYRVGVKTGTGQIFDPETKRYHAREYTAVMGGFAPLAAPQLTCVIVVSRPKYGKHHGGQAAGPVFSEVMNYALNELNVPKDPMQDDERLENYTMLARLGSGMDNSSVLLDFAEDIEVELASVDSELRGVAGDRITEGPTLPDLTHLSRRKARRKLAALQIEWTSRGAGRVVEQFPPPGTPLQPDTVCQLVFSNETISRRNKN